MDYKNKYLKYKNKYLNLKGGGLLQDTLEKHGIVDLNTKIPEYLLNTFKKSNVFHSIPLFKHQIWKSLLSINLTIDDCNWLIKNIDMYFASLKKLTEIPPLPEEIKPIEQVMPRIPEVIIPDRDVQLPNVFSDIYNLANGELGNINSERTPIKMTHILFKKYDDIYHVYGLYYHDCDIKDLTQIGMLKMLLEKRYTGWIQSKTKLNFPKEDIEPYHKTLTDVLKPEFWETSKFFILGSLIFKKSVSTINIMQFEAWNLVKTSGLKMLCTILWLFKNVKNLKISLKPGTVAVFEKFYKPLGFKVEEPEVSLDDIKNLFKPCEGLADDNIVKLILLNNNEYIESSDKMIKLIN